MLVLLRGPGDIELRAEIGEPSEDGMVFVRVVDGGTFIPYKATRFRTDDDLPVFEYAM
jgi:hypothetical protein